MTNRDVNINSSGSFTKPIYTVATLPTAASKQGEILWISDSNSACNVAFNQIAVGGGTFSGQVRSDGTNWRLHF